MVSFESELEIVFIIILFFERLW